MEEFVFNIRDYVYLEYAVAVVLFAELVRYLVKDIDKKVNPRVMTAIIATLLSVAAWFYYDGQAEHPWKSLISFAFSILAYDYIWKPIKTRFMPGFVDKQKH